MGLLVDWAAPDPAALGIRLARRLRLPHPDPDDERFALLLAGGVLRFVTTGPGGRERLVAVERLAAGDAAGLGAAAGPDDASFLSHGVRLLGVGWATVDRERARRQLASQFGLDRGAFVTATGDGWLGASAEIASVGTSRLVVLEPTTEGRVAAALARFGEGPVAVYLGLPGPASGAIRPGPLGAATLLPDPPAWGPFALVLAASAAASGRATGGTAGTIDG